MPSDDLYQMAVIGATRVVEEYFQPWDEELQDFILVLRLVDNGEFTPRQLGTSHQHLNQECRRSVGELIRSSKVDPLVSYREAFKQLLKLLELLGGLQNRRLRLTLGQLKLTLPRLRELGEPIGLIHLVDEAKLNRGNMSSKKST